jgi:lipid-A-disaccharide synthase
MTGALPFRLPAPAAGKIDLLVIAGEHSGDEHAARMVAAVRLLRPGVRVAALGGPRLAGAGAQLLHDLTGSSVVGLVEVLRNLSFFRALFEATLRWIADYRPSAVCFVDYPGLNLRLAEALRLRGLSSKGGGNIRALYYISPQIWAWKADRRFELARNLDALAVIFPFETECYADTGLPVEFVGHPFVAPDYAPPVRYDPDGPVLLLPGSRRQSVGRIFPALLAGYRQFAKDRPGRGAVVLYPSASIRTQLESLSPPADGRLEPTGSPVAASAVLTSSGTMSMQCALAGLPGAIAYRTNPLTYVMARWLVRVPFIGIANLLLGEPVYPEFIQNAASPDALARELESCIADPARRARTAAQSARLKALLARPAGENEAGWLARNLP